jgi:hypothetical protein
MAMVGNGYEILCTSQHALLTLQHPSSASLRQFPTTHLNLWSCHFLSFDAYSSKETWLNIMRAIGS